MKIVFWPKGYLPLGLSICLNASSSVLFKQAAISSGGSVSTLFLNRWYIGGLVLLCIQSLTWISALRQIPLSVAYPFISLIFPLGLVSGWLFFNETVSLNNLIGVLLITIGVMLVHRPKFLK